MQHIRELTPDPSNRRRHNPRNLGMLVDALQKVGASRSIVVDEDGLILAGNGVVEAASEAGITKLQIVEADGDTIVAVRRRGLTPGQKRDLAIYDNRTAELAEWNVEQLAADLKNGEDLSAFFYDDEVKALLAGAEGVKAGLTDPDVVPAERPTGIVAGDLFELGAHRLLCGDSTSKADVARAVGATRLGLVLTDPPYGIDLLGSKPGRVGGGTPEYPTRMFAAVHGDERQFDPRPLLLLADDVVVWGANYFAHLLPASKCWFVWNKNHPVDRTFANCELAWTSLKNRHAKVYSVTWDGWTKQGEDGAKVHPTQKPVKLFTDILADIAIADAVFDGYAGSGTTLIACEQTARACVAVEISPDYCQVIIDRWEAFTGQKAVKV